MRIFTLSSLWILVVCLLHDSSLGWATANDSPAVDTREQPNFLIIIADDLGYSDIGCYGGEIATPNLDSLAGEGLRFTDFYNTARCWPTRSALLTGYYPQQIRRDGMPGTPRSFGGGGKRPAWAKTVAEYLSSAGYRTYHSGKWHLDGKPLENGFDKSDEISRGPGFFEGLGRVDRDPTFYRTTATADHAIACLQDHAEQFPERPFFHYLAFHAPHFPLHALPEDIDRYRGRYAIGWDQLRQERFRRQKALGFPFFDLSLLEPDVGPPYAFPEQIEQLGSGEINRPVAWTELTDEQKYFQASKMEIHAAMIDRMDREIGRVLNQLRTMDAMDNTFICFLSDNGASAEIMVRGDGHDPGAAMGSAASYLCLGPGFSSAANTPFRRHKTWVHEGGICTPFIVHWPAGVKDKGVLRSNLGHVIDITPTVLELASAGSEQADGQPQFAGNSLVPALSDGKAKIHDKLWFYHEGNRGLRQGEWKIVHSNKTRKFPWREETDPESTAAEQVDWELYHLSVDRAEQNNLADQYPARVEQMSDLWWRLQKQFYRDATH